MGTLHDYEYNGQYNYEYMADTIDVSAIASDEGNARALLLLMRNNPSLTDLTVNLDDEEEGVVNYVPLHPYEFTWLGYYIGTNTRLRRLTICGAHLQGIGVTADDVRFFCECLKRNSSITCLDFHGMSSFGDGGSFGVEMFGPFLRKNRSLTALTLVSCDLADEATKVLSLATNVVDVGLVNLEMDEEKLRLACRALARLPVLEKLVLSGVDAGGNACANVAGLLRGQNGNLKTLQLSSTTVDDEGFDAVVRSLVGGKIEYLDLYDVRGISSRGWGSLSALFAVPSSDVLHTVDLSCNTIDDVGVEALVPSLSRSRVRRLVLSENDNITARGYYALSLLLGESNSHFDEIDVSYNSGFDDAGVCAFIAALAKDRTLKTLNLAGNDRITEAVQPAFFNLLCDASSINRTFFSNHTLFAIGPGNGGSISTDEVITNLLQLNSIPDKRLVAVFKVFAHRNLDMRPLFEWEFKTLPYLVEWFAMAVDGGDPALHLFEVQKRKLSVIYQFVRGMPAAYIDSCRSPGEIRSPKKRVRDGLDE